MKGERIKMRKNYVEESITYVYFVNTVMFCPLSHRIATLSKQHSDLLKENEKRVREECVVEKRREMETVRQEIIQLKDKEYSEIFSGVEKKGQQDEVKRQKEMEIISTQLHDKNRVSFCDS